MVENKLEFLRKYKKNVQIISYSDIKNLEMSEIPNYWRDLFQIEKTEEKVEMILSVWRKYVKNELRNTIHYLFEHLKEVELMDIDGRYSVLYTIETDDGEIEYYEGRNPKEKFNNNEELESNWERIPLSIGNFYENVHNGFYFYASKSMGLVPLEDVTFFDDDEWGIIEELEDPIEIDLKTTFGFFKSGMGGYVAIDYNNCANDNATLWWTNDVPRYNINFWDIVDDWIVSGFEN